MTNTEPLKNYIDARDAMKNGQPAEAAQLLAKSVGAAAPTPFMESAINELTEPNEAVLTLILNESKGVPHE